MKITVIQEQIIQPDLTQEELSAHWKKLLELPGVDALVMAGEDGYPSPRELDGLIGDSDALFGVWIDATLIREELFQRHPRLKYIATLGHGWEPFDAEMTRRYGVTVTNTVYGAQTIAEYAFALLMDACHHIAVHDARIHALDWSDPANRDEFCRAVVPQRELFGKTLGIVGLGAIGGALARMAAGFGLRVVSYSQVRNRRPELAFVEQVDTLEEVLSRSDFLSLHAPHTPDTENLIDAGAIARMKPGVIVINTARGALVDEAALADALRSGQVAAAAVDVLREEPPARGSPLLSAPNCTVTGHVAWLTRESRFRAIDLAVENFAAYLNGAPRSVING